MRHGLSLLTGVCETDCSPCVAGRCRLTSVCGTDCSFFASHFFSRTANLSSGVDVIHATRQVCCPAEKTAGKKTTRLKTFCVTFMQTRDMYLHFTRSNIWANGNR